MPTQDTPSKSLITNLSVKDIEALTQVLALKAGVELDAPWLAIQAQQLESLPKCLLAPNGGLGNIFRTTSSFHIGPKKVTLCHAHRRLHPQLIHRIFLQLVKECTVRNAGLVSCTNLPFDIKEWLKRIQMINSLWMSPELYRVAFNAMPEDERLEQVESGCEACILSIVGGHQLMVLDLRNSAESRKRKSPTKPPAILRLLDAWLAGTGLQEIPKKADEIMKTIRQIRRDLLVERRKQRDERKNGKKPAGINDQSSAFGRFEFDFNEREERKDEEGGNRDNEEDTESIIIFYNEKLTDTRGGLENTNPEQGMHPAFRQSMNLPGGTEDLYTAKPSSSRSDHDLERGYRSSSNLRRTQSIQRPESNGAYGEGVYVPPGKQTVASEHGADELKRPWYDESVYDPSEIPMSSTDATNADWLSTYSAETRWSDFGKK